MSNSNMIAAAPEMVSVLKSLRVHLNVYAAAVGLRSEEDIRLMLDSIDAVLRKAEPPRKRRVTVEVEVEVDETRDDDAIDRAIDLVRTGNGVVTGHRFGGVMG